MQHTGPRARVAEWQTRWLQVPVPARAWGFKSPLAHRSFVRTQSRQPWPSMALAHVTAVIYAYICKSHQWLLMMEGAGTMATTVAEGTRVMTTERESRLAKEILGVLDGPEGALAVERDGHLSRPLPPELGQILQQVLEVMARGGTVTVGSLPRELTTTSAAAVLGVSRPTLMLMIKDGRLPAHKVGTHTRLLAEDVLAERSARRARERAAFAELREIED